MGRAQLQLFPDPRIGRGRSPAEFDRELDLPSRSLPSCSTFGSSQTSIGLTPSGKAPKGIDSSTLRAFFRTVLPHYCGPHRVVHFFGHSCARDGARAVHRFCDQGCAARSGPAWYVARRGLFRRRNAYIAIGTGSMVVCRLHGKQPELNGLGFDSVLVLFVRERVAELKFVRAADLKAYLAGPRQPGAGVHAATANQPQPRPIFTAPPPQGKSGLP